MKFRDIFHEVSGYVVRRLNGGLKGEVPTRSGSNSLQCGTAPPLLFVFRDDIM